MCFKCFQLLQMYVLNVSSRCCIYFAMATHVFSGALDVCCKCFSCFGCMLQVFRLSVAKIDLVLHMLQWNPLAAATCCSCWSTVHALGGGIERGAAAGAGSRRGWQSGVGGPGLCV
jgi:hypothetical protein